jgi:hypothetical protein
VIPGGGDDGDQALFCTLIVRGSIDDYIQPFKTLSSYIFIYKETSKKLAKRKIALLNLQKFTLRHNNN